MSAVHQFVHLALKSSNIKTGKIPVTTTPRSTCPAECVHKGSSCYFENGGSAIFWSHLDDAARNGGIHAHTDSRGREYRTVAHSWGAFVAMIDSGAIRPGLARFAQGGDLPGDGRRIDRGALVSFAEASKRAGIRWIVYTHYIFGSPRLSDLLHNVSALRAAQEAGLNVNVSCDSVAQVDVATALGFRTALTESSDWQGPASRTPEGQLLAQCPATYRDEGPGSSCESCGGCALSNANRCTYVFPAHGSRKAMVDDRIRAALIAAHSN